MTNTMNAAAVNAIVATAVIGKFDGCGNGLVDVFRNVTEETFWSILENEQAYDKKGGYPYEYALIARYNEQLVQIGEIDIDNHCINVGSYVEDLSSNPVPTLEQVRGDELEVIAWKIASDIRDVVANSDGIIDYESLINDTIKKYTNEKGYVVFIHEDEYIYNDEWVEPSVVVNTPVYGGCNYRQVEVMF